MYKGKACIDETLMNPCSNTRIEPNGRTAAGSRRSEAQQEERAHTRSAAGTRSSCAGCAGNYNATTPQ